jgi:hypothetical protein
MDETNEWYCEFTLKNIPPVPHEALEKARIVVEAGRNGSAIVSYDATSLELYAVYRLAHTYTVGDVLTEGKYRMGRALAAALETEDLVPLNDRLKDFRIRPASDVPVDPDVQRYVDRMYGKGW